MDARPTPEAFRCTGMATCRCGQCAASWPDPYEPESFQDHLRADYDATGRQWPSRQSEFEPVEVHERDEAA